MHLRTLGNSGLEVSAISLGRRGLSASYGEPLMRSPESLSSGLARS
jgi:aryl-alcohol dehydrogenase-like predicted oxidoreductase